MTYGLVLCALCGRPRVADLSKATGTCPYCGHNEVRGRMRVVFESDSQSEVRAVMARGTGAAEELPPAEAIARKRRSIAEKDPHSTLVYRYEHAGDMEGRMTVLAEGLTSLLGEFTLDDMIGVAGPRAEKMLPAMLDMGFLIETRPGFYKGRCLPDRDSKDK